MSLKLQTIICSTRPGRIGPSIAQWFNAFASEQGSFDSELVDLADFNLPVYDEPNHPAMQQYAHEHTKAWSASVAQADAYVFVIPEYNFSPPPSLVNALNYLYKEWNYKPCGFVSYGGVSGGLRSAQSAKQLITTLKMMPMVEGVMVQMPWELLDEQKNFVAADVHELSGNAMLEEMAKWAQALKAMR
ncbi:NADPH-dependent FMN reductase [Pseudidiomarina salinarum]|uniref:NADPH-dependent FMN reductase n=1 Tax=Pseudidiomarina salinarum TaxID=435908 RepID=A0A094ITB0_9GAMM|nr:NAD(P)H-dependent oxidoreductase [Pseudidiomarina salinarum]KFZ30915.1 NADPH-dependent FMN reductase [Pseudidiomarina salinarum]RUO71398.1 NADPH-dependent oxidoreductase [Pseudidiomarina salinarum]